MAAVLEALPERLIERLMNTAEHSDYDATTAPPHAPPAADDAPAIDVVFMLRVFITAALLLYALSWALRRRRRP